MASTHLPTAEGRRDVSNNSAATVAAPLHSAAKLLTKVLYGEQVSSIVQDTQKMMDLSSTYLAFNDLSALEKTAILTQCNALPPELIQEFLKSPLAEIRQWTGQFVAHLTSYVSTTETSTAHHIPVQQPQRPQSIYSVWSDSKSIGATISIHAGAKPLIRLLYHRQSLNFMEKNRSSPLSAQVMDTFSRYQTNSGGFCGRAGVVGDADVIVELFTMQCGLLDILLSSPDTEFRRSTCMMPTMSPGYARRAIQLSSHRWCHWKPCSSISIAELMRYRNSDEDAIVVAPG
ncbi:hypothetical protein B0H13DRAFT_2343194 [Mycena leptocephala]|nr:hypothetical protein B0H13DRAFT_2343194 [Mycena leptocephala]